MDLFDAVNHAMATIATAGFSTYDNGLLHYNNPLIELVVFIFMVLAGANFVLYYRVYYRGLNVLWNDEEFRYFIYFVLATSCLISLAVYAGTEDTFLEAVRHSFFMVASFSSTTGFVSTNYEQWPAAAKLMLMLLYFTGGCAGSTAGGIKIARFVVLVRMTIVELKRVLHPRMFFAVKFEGKPLTVAVLASISRFFFLYVISVVVLSTLFAATGVSLTEAIFGVMACISSCGVAFGGIGLEGEFIHISDAGKLVLTLAMLLGRLEIYTVLVMLRKEFWHLNSRW
jgi:trk system potassium uptake protein TrkH